MVSRLVKVVEFFERRGHKSVVILLPQWRKEQIMGSISNTLLLPGVLQQQQQQMQMQQQQTSSGWSKAEQLALQSLEDRGVLYYSPTKRMGNRHIKCDDDSTILQFALQKEAIVVSNDSFKRFVSHSEYKQIIAERILMYTFIEDAFLPVEDPLGWFYFFVQIFNRRHYPYTTHTLHVV